MLSIKRFLKFNLFIIRIFKNNKKLIIGLAIFVILIIVKIMVTDCATLTICDPSPYCNYSIYYSFPVFTVVLIKLLPWLQIIGGVILIWVLGEIIINWIKNKKNKNN